MPMLYKYRRPERGTVLDTGMYAQPLARAEPEARPTQSVTAVAIRPPAL